MLPRVVEIELSLRPSLFWLLLTLTGAGVAAIACGLLQPWWLRVIMPILLVIYVINLLKCYFWQSHPYSILGIRYRGSRWWIQTQHGWWEASIKEPPLVCPFVTVMVFTSPEKHRLSVAIFCDGVVDKEAYRRLRKLLWLRKTGDTQ